MSIKADSVFWVEAIRNWLFHGWQHFGVDPVETFQRLCLFGVDGISGLISTELNAFLEAVAILVDVILGGSCLRAFWGLWCLGLMLF